MDEERGGPDPGPWTLRRCWVLGVVCALLGAVYKIVQHDNFLTNAWDLTVYDNVAWNTSQGRWFWSDLIGLNHMGHHFSPITALFAPLYLVRPDPRWLLAAQGMAAGIAVPLLILVADDLLRSAVAPLPGRWRAVLRLCVPVALVGLLFTTRTFMNSVQLDFHPSTLGIPLLAGAILALRRGRDRTFWVLVVLLLTTKEVALASVAGLAIYARFQTGRWRLAAGLLVLAIVGAYVEMGLVIPHFAGGSWGHMRRLGPLDDLDLKALYVGRLALSQGLLPLLAPTAWLAALPNTLVNCVTGGHQYLMRSHYDDQNIVFWAVAAAHGAARVIRWLAGRHEAGDRVSPAVFRGLLAAGGAVVVLAAAAFPWKSIPYVLNGLTPHPVATEARRRLAPYAALPPDVGMCIHDRLAPHLAYRHRIHTRWKTADPAAVLEPGDYAILPGHRMYEVWGEEPRIDDAEVLSADPRFEVEIRDEYVVVLRRVLPE